MEPRTPGRLSSEARACLQALGEAGLGRAVSLGGALALSYYHDYRDTHDVDAWWDEDASTADREAVVRCMTDTLRGFGEVRMRAWGDVVSVDVAREGRVVFGFQVARRSARLEAPVAAPWPPGVLLDSFDDVLASKMVALVERGAPRDFRDVHAVCEASLTDGGRCWSLWDRRQRAAGADASRSRARLAVQSHLARIELHRPLDAIPDAEDRSRARRVRTWFKGAFLDALLD